MAEKLLFGEHTRRLDERYRVSFPAELVETLFGEQNHAVLVKEQKGALSLWEAQEWQKRYAADMGLLEQKLAAGRLTQRRRELQTLGRLLSTRHKEVGIAGKSRLLIPEGFREFLNVEPGGDVIVLGAALCIEIWNPEAWHEHVEAALPDFQTMFDQLTE